MNKILFGLGLAISLASAQPARADVKESPSLRVVHWNVFYDGQGTDGVRDRGRQVTALAGLKPDVITLNEVTATATVDYAARLERATGVGWHHHHSSATAGGWGNAILTRYPLVSTSVYKMKTGAARSIAQATLQVIGSKVNVFATHLDSGDRPRNRAAQVQELLAFVSGFAAPRIFAGDMNAGPDAGEIQPLSANYDDTWLSAVHRGTASAYGGNPPHRYTRTRRSRLDYIFASRDLIARECQIPDLRDLTNRNIKTLLRTADDDGVRPSDHNLVSCVLAWKDAPPVDSDASDEDSGEADPDEPADTDDPGDTADPGDIPDPIDTNDPADPIGTDDPADPIGTDDPADPIDTDDPADPIDTDDPADPIDTDDPADPIDTDDPADPIDTDDPADPIGTDDPADPVDTDDPADPVDTDHPDDPGNTDDPGETDDDTDGIDPDTDVEPEGDVGLPPDWPCDLEQLTDLVVETPLLAPVTSNDDIVLRPATAATLSGYWIIERDCSAAGGSRVVNPDMNLPKAGAVAEPLDYFDMTFTADAGKPYRLWIRAKAERNIWRNDSVSVQFSGAVNARGEPVYRIGTADRTLVTLEDCVSCGVSGWGWQDNGFGAGVLGPEIYFETSGPQTIRIQRREDGISIDQVVLSAATWLITNPGALKDDATILPVRTPE